MHLFVDEFTDTLDATVGIRAVELLERLGWEVTIPDHVASGRPQLSKGLLREAKALAEEQRKAVEARASALAAELLASVGHRQPLPADHPAKTQTNGSDLEARYQDHLRKVSSSRRPA
mgnify:CR=1 FL=1